MEDHETDDERLVVDIGKIAAKKWAQQPHGTPVVPKSMASGVRRIVKSAQSNSKAAER